jgi:pSer/pThr/pTyr-binding forkhead associated (FHA) protein
MACVVLDYEGVDVMTHELIGDAVTIGRAPSNDIVIDHPTVSAQHARLTKSPSGYHLKDLESTNGTQINGVSISDAQLKDGAEIRFGYITGFFRDATAQRTASRYRDARQQSRSFTRRNQSLRRSPSSNRLG